MMSNKEIRAEAWQALHSGRCLNRFISVWLAFAGMSSLVNLALDGIAPGAEVLSGFVSLLIGALLSYALAAIALIAIGCDEKGEGSWGKRAFAAFRFPLSACCIAFLMQMFIFLWALLLIVPGIIAIYKYRMTWFIRANMEARHLNYTSAIKCIDSSKRMMDGAKMDLFRLDCSYWVSLTLAMLPCLLAAACIFFSIGISMLFAMVGCVAMFYVSVYMHLGQAIFFRERVKRISEDFVVQ